MRNFWPVSYKKDWFVDGPDFCLGLCHIMETSILSLLLVLWLKSLLNWLVVVVQRHYMIRSFSGFFCISLALIDSVLSLVLAAIFYLEDFNISGWHFTRFHVCLLTQVVCFIYAMLHWPVFLFVGLDNFWTLPSSSTHTPWKQKLTYIAGVCLLWILAALYVFWDPGFVLLLDDEKHKCVLFSSPQSFQVLLAMLLTVTCIILYSYSPFERWRVEVYMHVHATQQSCLTCLRRAMHTFLSTWASFLLLMIISPLLQMEMHAQLQLNVIWLCFVNSFFVALTLCGRSFTSTSKKSDTITDGFCSWYFCFTYGADEWNNGKQSSDRTQVKTLNI